MRSSSRLSLSPSRPSGRAERCRRPLTPASGEEGFAPELEAIPEEIREIVESGGVDPREWVAEWIEEVLTLSVGIVAQRCVARRMGVGEEWHWKAERRADLDRRRGRW